MTAVDIFKKRSGLTDTDTINMYMFMANDEVRTYLGYSNDKSIDRFGSAVANIAIAMYEYDLRNKSRNENIPSSDYIKSETFTEGAVSESKTYRNGNDLYEELTKTKDKILSKLYTYRLPHKIGE